jgi:hypothetical protein
VKRKRRSLQRRPRIKQRNLMLQLMNTAIHAGHANQIPSMILDTVVPSEALLPGRGAVADPLPLTLSCQSAIGGLTKWQGSSSLKICTPGDIPRTAGVPCQIHTMGDTTLATRTLCIFMAFYCDSCYAKTSKGRKV